MTADVADEKRCVLVIDDDDLVRAAIEEMLDHLGFAPVGVEGGEQALQCLQAMPRLDLLVTDIMMPGMDGWTAAERVREVHADVPIVYLTGYYDLKVRRPLGRSILMLKPVVLDDLEKALKELAAYRRSSERE